MKRILHCCQHCPNCTYHCPAFTSSVTLTQAKGAIQKHNLATPARMWPAESYHGTRHCPWYKSGRCSLENHSPHKKLLTESLKLLVHWMENGAWKTWNGWEYKENSAISPSQAHFICLPLSSSTEWWYLYLPMSVKCPNMKHYTGKPQKTSMFLWKMG